MEQYYILLAQYLNGTDALFRGLCPPKLRIRGRFVGLFYFSDRFHFLVQSPESSDY